MFHFYTPCKHQKTSCFLMFSGDIRSGTLVENGLNMKIRYNFKVNLLLHVPGLKTSSYTSKLRLCCTGTEAVARRCFTKGCFKENFLKLTGKDKSLSF